MENWQSSCVQISRQSKQKNCLWCSKTNSVGKNKIEIRIKWKYNCTVRLIRWTYIYIQIWKQEYIKYVGKIKKVVSWRKVFTVLAETKWNVKNIIIIIFNSTVSLTSKNQKGIKMQGENNITKTRYKYINRKMFWRIIVYSRCCHCCALKFINKPEKFIRQKLIYICTCIIVYI